MSFSQHVASLVAFRFTGSGAVESFSVTRSRISRANDRVGYLRAQFARPVERYRVAWPVRRVLTWVFSRVCARFSYSSSIRERALSLAAGVQPDCNFRSPVSNRGSPTISKPENEGMPFKRICDLLTFMMSHTRAGKRRCSARIFGLAFLVPNRSPADSSGEVP